MPTMWTYPWHLYREGLDNAFSQLAEHTINRISVASHYHSVRTMEPRFPESLFDSYPAGSYFSPDPERFADTPIDPLPNEFDEADDPLLEIVNAASAYGMDVAGWTVCLHNTRLGAEYPKFQIESAFGDAHEHAFCPSNPEVRTFLADVAAAVSARGVDEVQLESVGYPGAFHEHGASYGHDKRQVLTSDAEAVLLSQCFCDACREAAADHPVDMAHAKRTVQDILRASFDRPHSDSQPLSAIAREHPEIGDLFDFRAYVVTDLFERIAVATGSTPVNYYVMEQLGVDPGVVWPSGIVLERVEKHVDRMTALCYDGDPTVARRRIETLARRVDCPLDAGVTLDPDVVENRAQLAAVVDGVQSAVAGDVLVYNHALATEAQLEWVADVFD